MEVNPRYARKRIFGTETEFGNVDYESISLLWLCNGGKIYDDCDHIEYASPETSNPLDAVLYDKAGDAWIMKNKSKGSVYYKNNWSFCLDGDGKEGESSYFGAHENYFIDRDIVSILDAMVPFLVTRQIFAGTGKINPKGKFEISQRSSSIERLTGGSTTDSRDIINTKDESHTDLSYGYRLHLILGDSNMCQVATYLKLGTTSLVLDSLEDRAIPDLRYDTKLAVTDVRAISRMTGGWKLQGTKKSALDVQKLYLDAAKVQFSGRDTMTDDILARWENTLHGLEHDQKSLFGKVDWITKKRLIDSYASKHHIDISSNYNNNVLRNIDLQYHDIDKDKGLFYAMQNKGLIERLFSDVDIERAVTNAPTDTRAHFRGLLAKVLKVYPSDYVSHSIDWDSFRMPSNRKLHHPLYEKFGFGATIRMGDPFNTYSVGSKTLEDLLPRKKKSRKPALVVQKQKTESIFSRISERIRQGYHNILHVISDV